MIYLASPYSSGIADLMEHRYELAMRAVAGLFHQGIVVYSPIVHWHEVAKKHGLPRDYKPWVKQDEGMIDVCDEFWILTLEDWDQSSGVASDQGFAKAHEKKIRLVSMEECFRGIGSNDEPKEA